MPTAHSVDGTPIVYESLGAGEPLLLVAGQACDGQWWAPLRAHYAVNHRVITFDHRGTGASGKPLTPYTTQLFAADAVAVLDHAGVARAHVVGHSMGGRVAQWLGVTCGARVGGLVLAATTPGNAHGVARDPVVNAALVQGRVDTLLPYLVSRHFAKTHPDYVLNLTRTLVHSAINHRTAQHYQASEGHDAWELLSTITNPTLILHGQFDQINRVENAALLQSQIPNAHVHYIAGGRHSFFHEFIDESARVVLEFLTSNPLEESLRA